MSSERIQIATTPIKAVADIESRWPGALAGDFSAITRFIFHATGHFPADLYSELNRTYDENGSKLDDNSETARMLLRAAISGYHNEGKPESRIEVARKVARNTSFALESKTTFERIAGSISLDEAVEVARSFIKRHPVSEEQNYGPSQLFPEGRTIRTPLAANEDGLISKQRWGALLTIETVDGIHEFPDEIADVSKKVFRKKVIEAHADLMDQVEPIDQIELSSMRSVYGAKAANLLLFQQAFNKLRADFKYPDQLVEFTIPPFIAVPISVYQAWEKSDPSFKTWVGTLRQEARTLMQADQSHGRKNGLTVIRSSAVYSEDGDKLSGAGIYDSLAADPFDAQAFEDAIVKVFESTNSPKAIAYRKAHGIKTEEMGLVIQNYIESGSGINSTRYGYVNSRSNDSRITECVIDKGSLLFDHYKISSQLLLSPDGEGEHAAQQYLHTIPDHRNDVFRNLLRGMNGGATEIAHAAVLAEKLFGKPVQIEFANGNVLQVRPIPNYQPSKPEIVFPIDKEPIAWVRATGIGDMTLRLLSPHGDNQDNEGVVVFRSENRFTTGINNAGFESMPGKGAVIILHNDGYSGHVQMLAQEQALMCLFPDIDETLEKLEDFLFRNTVSVQSLHLISDGFRGAIYESDEDVLRN